MPQLCIQCAKRKDDCCSSDYAKFATLKDAERIAKFLGIEAKQLASFSGLTERDKETELFTKKPHKYYYDLALNDKILQLKKKADGSCKFHSKEGLCKIYAVRPLICRIYPFWYSKDGEIITDNNGLECEARHTGYDKPAMNKLILQLIEEIKDYKNNVNSFVRRNGL